MSDQFDIVYVCHEKDRQTLEASIRFAKKNVVGFRKIFLVAKENFLVDHADVEFVDESLFPFRKNQLSSHVPPGRSGWYFQQLLKLYFFRVMGKKAHDNILILDADTLFIRKTTFFENSIPLYNVVIAHHEPYFQIMENLFGFNRQHQKYSGVAHHMIFQRDFVNEILNDVESRTGNEFWQELLCHIDQETISGFSEYELYFSYMIRKHPDSMKIRKLGFVDFPFYSDFWVKTFRTLGYSYLSAHEYLRLKRFPVARTLALELLNVFRLRMPVKNTLMALGIRKRG